MRESTLFLYINLDRDTDRKVSFECAARTHSVEITRISGVDGSKYLEHPNTNRSKFKEHLSYGRSLSVGEIGCYKSHVKALNFFLDTKHDYAVVMEDDFAINKNFTHIVSCFLDLASRSKNVGICNIYHPAQQYFFPLKAPTARYENVFIGRAFNFPTHAAALLWTRTGAKDFLSKYDEPLMPFDQATRMWATELGNGLSLSLKIFSKHPSPSSIDTLGGDRPAAKSGNLLADLEYGLFWNIRDKKRKKWYRKNLQSYTKASQSLIEID